MRKRQTGNGSPHEGILKASHALESAVKSKAAHRCHTRGKLPRVRNLKYQRVGNTGAGQW